jgi:hypothetical protein
VWCTGGVFPSSVGKVVGQRGWARCVGGVCWLVVGKCILGGKTGYGVRVGCCCGVLRGVVCEGVLGVHVWSVLKGMWVGSLGGLCGWGVLLGCSGDGLG